MGIRMRSSHTRATIDRVGLLSERWFLYIEDTEYSKRVLDADLKIKVLSKAHAFHEIGGSARVAENVEADNSDGVGKDAEVESPMNVCGRPATAVRAGPVGRNCVRTGKRLVRHTLPSCWDRFDVRIA